MQLHKAGNKEPELNIALENLIDRSVNGDAEAFRRLYDVYADRTPNDYSHNYEYLTTGPHGPHSK